VSSGFHPDELLKSLSRYPVVKYETAGHAFNGNQYTTASGELRDHALQTLKDVRGGNSAGSAGEHSNIAFAHREAAKAIEAGMKGAKIPLSKWGAARKAIDAHNAASDAHIKASSASAKVAVQSIKPATGSTVSRNKMNALVASAKDASENASYASANADEMTKGMGNL